MFIKYWVFICLARQLTNYLSKASKKWKSITVLKVYCHMLFTHASNTCIFLARKLEITKVKTPCPPMCLDRNVSNKNVYIPYT